MTENQNLNNLYDSSYEIKMIDMTKMASINEEVVRKNLLGTERAFVYWQANDYVTFGDYRSGRLNFRKYEPAWDCVQEIRVFNQNAELHIWKQGSRYRGRLIYDESVSADAQGNCFIHNVKLWGTAASKDDPDDNWLVLSEKRGMRLDLPVKWENSYESGINLFLEERLYLEEDDIGCIYIADRRFSRIRIGEDIGKNGYLQEMEVKDELFY